MLASFESPSSSEVFKTDTNVAPHILTIEKEKLVRERGTKPLLPDGNCDRMDLKVLALANHSKFSTDYLKQFCSAKLDWTHCQDKHF